MRFGPLVGFARRSDGHRLAYQVLSDADLDLVLLHGYASHLGLQWVEPSVAGFLDKLAAFSRLILLDRLGNGLSDRGPTGQSFEDDLDDVRLVLDTVGSTRAAFFGTHLGGRLALLFAATYPGADQRGGDLCVPSGQHARRRLPLGLQRRRPRATPGRHPGWFL
jgi:pimeloyl-ACP methyl ester carboxylesterase